MMTASLNVIKYLLFLFNVLFVVTGLVLLSVGAAIKAVYSDYQHHFLDDRYLSAPNLLIAVGSIILLVSFLACCGAIKENHCMIVTYIGLLILIFILELSAGIAGYVCRDAAADLLQEKLMDTMHNYGMPKSDEVTVLWDLMQRRFKCCGVSNYTDWKANNNKTSQLLPLSCCPEPSGVGPWSCINSTTIPAAYSAGCKEKFGEFVRDEAVVIGGAGITIALIQLLGILMACRLAGAMRRAVSELNPM